MYKIFQFIEGFFNSFAEKDTDTQVKAIKRLFLAAVACALAGGVIGAIASFF